MPQENGAGVPPDADEHSLGEVSWGVDVLPEAAPSGKTEFSRSGREVPQP